MNKEEFFEKYNIDNQKFNDTGLVWDELIEIYNHYNSIRDTLLPIAHFFADLLRAVPCVHSVRTRIKDPEHLLEKIIRKTIEDPLREITLKNYFVEITDLIGVRVLHLFKDDWDEIHDMISDTWEFKQRPTANIRKGDSQSLVESFKAKNCSVEEHPFGYRSVHYIVASMLNKKDYSVEIQVRTIFEEAWSEVDHKIRYPYKVENKLLSNYLVIFNRLAGSADEMGSFIRVLDTELTKSQEKYKKEIEAKNSLMKDLKETVDELEMETEKREKLEVKLEELSSLHKPFFGSSLSALYDINSLETDLKNLSILRADDFDSTKLLATRIDDIDCTIGKDKPDKD